jgi:deoxyribodipyrimidine photo-lyase
MKMAFVCLLDGESYWTSFADWRRRAKDFYMVIPFKTGAREERAKSLAVALEGLYLEGREGALPAPMKGGRKAALEAWAKFSVVGYASRRNFVPEGMSVVSRLSPYIRHGVLSLGEVAERIRRDVGGTSDAIKFWAELGWRVFWRGLWSRLGDDVYRPIEEPKVPLGKVVEMPADILEGRTGLVCMDESVRELVETGYLHNHARMWLASYIIHFRKIDWRAGERFFYQHLLDGDPASNALSWQWVASTFSHKPYIFNRENVEKYTAGEWCVRCRARCPFADSYPNLERRLFGEENAG